MIFNVVYALGELAVMFPISGGFYTYSSRFIDPSWGFAMGWNYVFQWAIVLPLEINVAGLTIGYWDPEQKINIAVWVTVFLIVIIIINIFGVLGYAEEEFWVSILKLTTVVVFMVSFALMVARHISWMLSMNLQIIALVLVCGGGSQPPFNEYYGARNWYNPGAFADGFPGLCAVFVTAAFSFSGTELVGLAAAESKTPQQSLPGAVKQVFWRIVSCDPSRMSQLCTDEKRKIRHCSISWPCSSSASWSHTMTTPSLATAPFLTCRRHHSSSLRTEAVFQHLATSSTSSSSSPSFQSACLVCTAAHVP